MTFNLTQLSSRHTRDMPAGKQAKNIWAYFVTRLLKHIQVGSLSVILPGGARLESHAVHTEQHATVIIHDVAALRRLILGGSIGFSESYISGHWTSPDLPGLIEILALNGETLFGRLRGSAPLWLMNYILHRLKRNSRQGSKNNISYHYDLGNDFYQKWLGSDMIYSSAIFAGEGDDLDQAQKRKMNRIIDLLDISEQSSVLEIGCGWGALSRYIAENKKSRVHGMTLSKQQLSDFQLM